MYSVYVYSVMETTLLTSRRIEYTYCCTVAGLICGSMFLVSIPFVLGNGVYLFQLWDQFSVTFPLLLIGFFEFIAVAWAYGVKK